METRVLIKEKGDWWFVKTLKPFSETNNTKEAMVFGYSQAEKVLYLYGLEDDYEIYEL